MGLLLRTRVLAAYQADRPLSERRARQAAEAGHREGMTVYGLGLAGDGRFAEAEHWLHRAMDAGDPLAAAALGTLCVERGDGQRGMAYLRAAEASHGALSARLALVQVWARRTVPFDRKARAAGAPDPALPPSPSAEGRAAVRAGRSAADWAELRRALKPDPATDSPDIIEAMLVMRAPEGDFLAAHAWFTAAAELADAERLRGDQVNAEDPAVLHDLGCQFMDRGEDGKAQHCFRMAAAGGYTDAFINLGVLLRRAGDLDGAETCYRQAIDAGDLADGHNNLGNLRMQRGDRAGAAEHWRIAASHGSGAAMASCGALHAERGELQQAEDFFRRSADTGDTAGLLNLAHLLESDGRIREATHWLEAASGAPDASATPPTSADHASAPDTEGIADWLRDPAERGDPAARQALDQLDKRRPHA